MSEYLNPFRQPVTPSAPLPRLAEHVLGRAGRNIARVVVGKRERVPSVGSEMDLREGFEEEGEDSYEIVKELFQTTEELLDLMSRTEKVEAYLHLYVTSRRVHRPWGAYVQRAVSESEEMIHDRAESPNYLFSTILEELEEVPLEFLHVIHEWVEERVASLTSEDVLRYRAKLMLHRIRQGAVIAEKDVTDLTHDLGSCSERGESETTLLIAKIYKAVGKNNKPFLDEEAHRLRIEEQYSDALLHDVTSLYLEGGFYEDAFACIKDALCEEWAKIGASNRLALEERVPLEIRLETYAFGSDLVELGEQGLTRLTNRMEMIPAAVSLGKEPPPDLDQWCTEQLDHVEEDTEKIRAYYTIAEIKHAWGQESRPWLDEAKQHTRLTLEGDQQIGYLLDISGIERKCGDDSLPTLKEVEALIENLYGRDAARLRAQRYADLATSYAEVVPHRVRDCIQKALKEPRIWKGTEEGGVENPLAPIQLMRAATMAVERVIR